MNYELRMENYEWGLELRVENYELRMMNDEQNI